MMNCLFHLSNFVAFLAKIEGYNQGIKAHSIMITNHTIVLLLYNIFVGKSFIPMVNLVVFLASRLLALISLLCDSVDCVKKKNE